jgi:putative FmdB family regulatory protein
MPTYEYRCDQCGDDFEVWQSIKDDPLTECPRCGRPIRKVLSPAGIVLKGSGFYKTDSRKSAEAHVGDAKGDGESKTEKSETKSEGETKSEKSSDAKSAPSDKKAASGAKD